MKVDTFRFWCAIAGFEFACAIVYRLWHYTLQMRVNGVEIDGVEVAPGKTHMKAVRFANQVEVEIVLHIAQRLNVWKCWSGSSEVNLGNK